jgi:serine/threonine-protein kinase
MAEVWRARDLSLDRECAVKVLHRHLQSERESRLRFAREAQAVARLRHPNILEIYAYSVDEADESFLVTEFIDGPTLRAHINQHRPRFPEIAAMIGCQVARALALAHRQGVVHRDIKPENIMIRRSGRGEGCVVLCDFGIARIADKDHVTTTGQLLGSPAYMAPEHIKGQRVDSRSDLYSLGTVLYELISGQLPFLGQNPHDTLVRIAAGEHAPVSELSPLCSPSLARVVERALSCDPAERPAEADLLLQELQAALADSGLAADEIDAQLSAYFKDPSAWEAAFADRLRQHLIAQGRSQKQAGNTAAALSLWARAQQLAPQDREIAALLSSLSRQAQRRRLLQLGAGGLAALGLLALLGPRLLAQLSSHGPGSSGLPRFPSPASPSLGETSAARGLAASLVEAPEASVAESLPSPVAESLSLPTAAPSQLAVSHDGVVTAGQASRPPSSENGTEPEGLPRPRPQPTAVRPHPATPAPVHWVRLEPWPKAVRVTHNGRLLGVYGTDVRSVQLAGGRNEFLFENPACYSERVQLPPGVFPAEVRVRLRWKPALLLVRASQGSDGSPLTADVVVDSKLAGRSGQVVAVPIVGDDSSRSLDVQVSAPGHKSAMRSLTVRANQLTQLDVQLSQL